MLTQIDVIDAVKSLRGVGRDATSHSIRKLTGGSHVRLTKIMRKLIEQGIVSSNAFRHRANCNSVCYSLTRKGVDLHELIHSEYKRPKRLGRSVYDIS